MNKHILIIMLLPVLLTFTSCKTTEDNYRAAYERAKAKEAEGLEPTVYDKIRQEAMPEQMVIDGDTIGMKGEYVAITPNLGTPTDALHRYSVVVAGFKQLFHAKSMKNRIAGKGYQGTFIVQTREPFYYVVVLSTDTLSYAASEITNLEANPPLRFQENCPWILHAPNR